MKELKYSLLYVTITQILCWGIFLIFYELPFLHPDNAELIASIAGGILILITSIIYVLFNKKIINKYNLKSTKYNIFLFVIWNILTILITIVLNELIKKDLIHSCYNTPDDTWLKCFLNGIEVLIYGFALVSQSVVIFIITLIKRLILKLIKE